MLEVKEGKISEKKNGKTISNNTKKIILKSVGLKKSFMDCLVM